MQRVFMDWDRPFLREAARWSIRRVRSGREVDLSTEEHLLAGRRATRRYLELLLDECERDGLLLDPPELLTPHSYCARHARDTLRPAGDLELEFAWRNALERADDATRQALAFGPRDHAWLAPQLSRLHRELALHEVSLNDDGSLPIEMQQRVAALATLRELAEGCLRANGLQLLEAMRLATETDTPLIVIGVVELPATLRGSLDVHPGATALIHASPHDAHRFDRFGQPLRDAWGELVHPMELRVAENPAQLAALAIARLGELEELPRDRIVLGLLDPQIEAPLRCELESEGFELHRAEGVSVEAQALWQALSALAELAREGSARALGRFVRSSLVEARLRERGGADFDPIAALDEFASEHLLHRVASPWPPPGARPELRDALEWIDGLCSALRGPSRPLPGWCEAIRNCVQSLHGNEELELAHPAGRRGLALLDALRDQLETLERWPGELASEVDGHVAVELLLKQLRGVHLSELPDPEAIEAVGWLELASDDAEHVLLLGANEGCLPSTTAADPLLPDGVRARLGLPHDAMREARDVYLLERLLRAHASCTIFVSRRDSTAASVLPSRLLLRCDEQELPRRLRALLSPAEAVATWRQRLDARDVDDPSIHRPPQLDPAPLRRLRVTDFASWQKCPYRHQLGRVLRLRARDFEPRELDAGQFGTLLHRILDSFAKNAPALRRADEIEQWLRAALDERMRRDFASWAHPAARLQAQLATGRLAAFARLQQRRRDEGWEIVQSELELSLRTTIDGEEVEISGSIDRVDRHPDRGIAILDIKTSSQATDPLKAHGPDRKGDWIDFQLPLYRRLYLAGHPDIDAQDIELGYLQLPQDSEATTVAMAVWSEEQHESNWSRVQEIVRAMRRGEGLDAPISPPPRYSDGFALICRDEVLAEEES